MKTLFVTDLDGTLLGSDSRVSAVSARILSELNSRGALVTVATARTPATVVPLLEHTGMHVPAIVMTGASLWDFSTSGYLEPILFPPGVASQTVSEFVSAGVNPFVYALGEDGRLTVWHNSGMTRHEDSFYQERRNLPLKRFVLDTADGYATVYKDVILLLGIGETPRIEALAERLRIYGTLSVSAYQDIFNPKISYIEVFASGVSKADAVMRVKEMTGADRVVVYGDNLNDLPMFAVADEAVAVANARPQVLAAADRIIGPNTEDSVAKDMMERM